MPESKKVSRACNTCRAKRKKCDGREPCSFCTDNGAECSFSTEPRKRGPPAGYLRHVETRLNVLEVYVGLLYAHIEGSHRKCGQHPHCSSVVDPAIVYSAAADQLSSERANATQDVWDRHRALWIESQAYQTLEKVTKSLAPFAPREVVSETGESAAHPSPTPDSRSMLAQATYRPLLPVATPKDDAEEQGAVAEKASAGPLATSSTVRANTSPRTNVYSETPPAWGYAHPESCERSTSRAITPTLSPVVPTALSERGSRPAYEARQHPSPPFSVPLAPSMSQGSGQLSVPHQAYIQRPEAISHSDYSSVPVHPSAPNAEVFVSGSATAPSVQPLGDGILGVSQPPGADLDHSDIFGSEFGLLPQDYEGSYWRTAELKGDGTVLPSHRIPVVEPVSTLSHPFASHMPADIYSAVPATTATQNDLPGADVLERVLETYYEHVHPMFPILPERQNCSKILGLSEQGWQVHSEAHIFLIWSLCAYCGRLDSTLPATTPLLLMDPGAGAMVADLWYEKARDAMNTSLRHKPCVQTVQGLLLLALRDWGQGYEGQAWLLAGIAVRMCHELRLHRLARSVPPPKSTSSSQPCQEDGELSVAEVAHVVDTFVSLQIGASPSPTPDYGGQEQHIELPIVGPPSTPQHGDVSHRQRFHHIHTLCRVISRIQSYLSLPTSATSTLSRKDRLSSPHSLEERRNILESELEDWHHVLPGGFRVSIGERKATRAVLELNMMHCIAVILLWRSDLHNNNTHATRAILEASSTFNVLLEKYLILPTGTKSPLAYTNPLLSTLIFTAGVAHVSVSRALGTADAVPSVTARMQMELHVLRCGEALAAAGETWELARRARRGLQQLLADTQVPDPTLSLGKRKREEDTESEASGRAAPKNAAMARPEPTSLNQSQLSMGEPPNLPGTSMGWTMPTSITTSSGVAPTAGPSMGQMSQLVGNGIIDGRFSHGQINTDQLPWQMFGFPGLTNI